MYVEADVAVKRLKPIPHKVFRWKRCDTDRLRASTKEFVDISDGALRQSSRSVGAFYTMQFLLYM